jgi:hypothetical protein
LQKNLRCHDFFILTRKDTSLSTGISGACIMDIKSIDSEDLPTNISQNEHFQSVVNRAVGRRGFLKFGSGAAVAAFLAGPLAGCGGTDTPAASLLGFKAVAANGLDTVTVAEGYTATTFVLYRCWLDLERYWQRNCS